jgi:phage tail sheath protein FI
VRVRVEEFLHQLFRSGAFPGSKPEEGYFVLCDRTTMTQADIDANLLRMLVGFAPTRPAEFIPLEITLAVGQAA